MNDQERDDAARVQLEQATASDDCKFGHVLYGGACCEPLALPPALTDDERQYLEARRTFDPTTAHALAWIDAATAVLAEQAAQIVQDGLRVAELEAELTELRAAGFK